MVNSKQKGNNFENKIYKMLRDYGDCKKSLGSGCSDEPGDIIFRGYVIECKCHKEVSEAKLKNWGKKLYQEVKDKCEFTRVPLLVYKENNKPIQLGMCKHTGFEHIGPFQNFIDKLEEVSKDVVPRS